MIKLRQVLIISRTEPSHRRNENAVISLFLIEFPDQFLQLSPRRVPVFGCFLEFQILIDDFPVVFQPAFRILRRFTQRCVCLIGCLTADVSVHLIHAVLQFFRYFQLYAVQIVADLPQRFLLVPGPDRLLQELSEMKGQILAPEARESCRQPVCDRLPAFRGRGFEIHGIPVL